MLEDRGTLAIRLESDRATKVVVSFWGSFSRPPTLRSGFAMATPNR